MGNSGVRHRVLGPRVQSPEQALDANRLMWLKHVLDVPTEQLPSFSLFTEAGNRWGMMGQDGQSMTR